MLSHANLLSSGRGLCRRPRTSAPTDELLCYLPMAWIGNSLFSLVLTLLVGFTCNFPERPETVQRDLRELGPTIALAPPRIWENMLTAVRVRAADSDAAQAPAVRVFRGVAERAEALRGRRQAAVPLGLRLGLRARRNRSSTARCATSSGLRRARWVYTGGAPLGADTFRFFRSFGVNLKQVYGARPSCPGSRSVQPDGEVDPDTVGRVIPGTEVRIAEDGEVLVRSAGVFQGYYKQPEATREAMTEDGWLRTGDAGFVDRRGHLVIVDRAQGCRQARRRHRRSRRNSSRTS